MKLIQESVREDIELLIEEKGSSKSYFIKGVFAQSEVKNRNGRIYPKSVMEREVSRYNQRYIKEGRSLGELGHPSTPAINLDRASHIIKELYPSGNDIIGKAKLMDTPCGKIAKNLIDEGVRLGVSTRGVGSLKEQNGIQVVQEDFSLATIDIVADPSAPSAYVDGIFEGVEWLFDEKLGWKAVEIAENHRAMVRGPVKIDEEKAFRLFEQYLNSLKDNR